MARYRALAQAIGQGLVASCHGIYRGGLGVHLAMKAMAGELGLGGGSGRRAAPRACSATTGCSTPNRPADSS